MDDLISRVALRGALLEYLFGQCNAGLIQILDEAPTVAAEPVRHGRWREMRNPYGELEGWIHDNCGFSDTAAMNFCAYCGAKMDAEQFVDTNKTLDAKENAKQNENP